VVYISEWKRSHNKPTFGRWCESLFTVPSDRSDIPGYDRMLDIVVVVLAVIDGIRRWVDSVVAAVRGPLDAHGRRNLRVLEVPHRYVIAGDSSA